MMSVPALQIDNVADWPVQLGPEFIHGAKSSPEGGLRPRINEFTWSEDEEDLNSAHLQMVHHSELLLPPAVQRILEEVGCQCQEYEWPDYWYFGKERLLIRPGDQVTSALMMLMIFCRVACTSSRIVTHQILNCPG